MDKHPCFETGFQVYYDVTKRLITEVAKLEKAERRYAWIKRQLRSNEEVWSIFPPSWRVAHTLCMQFCKVTR